MNDMRKYINLVEMMLTEKHYSGPLYHLTTTESAYSIIKNGILLFSSPKGDENEETLSRMAGKEYNYYMSTARSMRNSYYIDLVFRNNLTKPINIVFNGDYFIKHRFKIQPTSYYGTEFKDVKTPKAHNLLYGSKETEERIWSKKSRNKINPQNAIKSVHVLYIESGYSQIARISFLKDIKRIGELCQKMQIPILFYDDLEDFLNFRNKRRKLK